MVDIKKHFEQMAGEYDRVIRHIAPHYESMLDAVVESLPMDRSNSGTIIDVGCGSGNLSLRVEEAFPETSLIGIDVAEEMIAIAAKRLEKPGKARFVQTDILDYDFPPSIAAVVSTLALHHIRSDGQKKDLYKRVCRALKPGGVFVVGDIILGETEYLEALNQKKWKEHMLINVARVDIDHKWVPRHKETDRPCRLSDELEWLREAGFTRTFVVWKYFNVAVYGGER